MKITLKLSGVYSRPSFRRLRRRTFGMNAKQWATRAEQAGIPHDEPHDEPKPGPTLVRKVA